MDDDKLEPQGDGCTKSTLNKMNTPWGDHLEVRVAPTYGFGLSQANPRLTKG